MDISHYFSGDATIDNAGNLATVDGITEGQQRLLRRILTPPGDYIQHPGYGVGAGAYVGATTAELGDLEARILQACTEEPYVVSMLPLPTITLRATATTLYCTINYVDASTQTTQTLSFSTGA